MQNHALCGQFLPRDSKVLKNWKGVQHIGLEPNIIYLSIEVHVTVTFLSQMPLKMTFDLQNDLEAQK